MIDSLRKDLRNIADPQKAVILARFFKTGKGEYGEGDVFLGITVPESRKIAVKYKDLTMTEVKDLLNSKVHEERLIALLILIMKYKKADEYREKEIADFYISNTSCINNWDLVDLSADKILGEYLFDKDKKVLEKLAASENLWERRISVITTFAFLKRGESEWTLKIAGQLIKDKNDLIQKAVGWMLRELGKRVSRETEERFLKKHYKTMGRTALRYAIEHFEEGKRKKYLAGEV